MLRVLQLYFTTGVCVKGLSFPEKDLSLQLAQWLAIHIALGVSRCGACMCYYMLVDMIIRQGGWPGKIKL